jgi:hypothetical protein
VGLQLVDPFNGQLMILVHSIEDENLIAMFLLMRTR